VDTVADAVFIIARLGSRDRGQLAHTSGLSSQLAEHFLDIYTYIKGSRGFFFYSLGATAERAVPIATLYLLPDLWAFSYSIFRGDLRCVASYLPIPLGRLPTSLQTGKLRDSACLAPGVWGTPVTLPLHAQEPARWWHGQQ
jgi:hypothetical protein